MWEILPERYYSFEGGVDWGRVAACLIVTDGLQFIMHQVRLEREREFFLDPIVNIFF